MNSCAQAWHCTRLVLLVDLFATAERQFVISVAMCLATSTVESGTVGVMNRVRGVNCVRQVIKKGRREKELVRMMLKLLHVNIVKESVENFAELKKVRISLNSVELMTGNVNLLRELMKVNMKLNSVELVTDCAKLAE